MQVPMPIWNRHFPAPPLSPHWEMQTVHFMVRLQRKPTFSCTSSGPSLGDANCTLHNTIPYDTDIFPHLLWTLSGKCKLYTS